MTRRADLAEFLLAQIAEDEYFGTHDRHLAKRWDAECEAKRRVLARHAPYFIKGYPPICDYCEGAPDWPCSEVLDIASVYAGHPDYREEWKP